MTDTISLAGLRGGADLHERLELSAGTIAAGELTSSGKVYRPDSIIPRSPWRRPAPADVRSLLGSADSREHEEQILHARIPADIARSFRRTLRRLAACGSESDFSRSIDDRELRRSVDELTAYATRTFGSPAREPMVRIARPGLLTVTDDGASFIGLHIDNWFALPWAHRRASPRRLCVNVGFEPRYFLYCRRRMSHVARIVRARRLCPIVNDRYPDTRLAMQYLSAVPDEPIIRLRIEPGEAYLANTENLIHDASTDGTGSWDCTVQLHVHCMTRTQPKTAP